MFSVPWPTIPRNLSVSSSTMMCLWKRTQVSLPVHFYYDVLMEENTGESSRTMIHAYGRELR